MMVFTPNADCDLEEMIAKVSGKEPLVLIFTSSFCGPSNLMMPMFYELAAEFPRAAFYIIDVETFPAITRKYSVKGTPAMVLLNNGEPRASMMGTMTFDQMCEWMDTLEVA